MNLVKYQWEPCKKKKTLIKIFQNVDDGAMCQISAVVFWKKKHARQMDIWKLVIIISNETHVDTLTHLTEKIKSIWHIANFTFNS